MHIREDVHNYMETIVGNLLSHESYVEKYDNEQLADLACIALNQLRPIYIRYTIDFLSSLPEEKIVAITAQAQTAIDAGLPLIDDDRRTNRFENVPAITRDIRFDEEVSLEWFETSYLKSQQN
ncbi:late competence development ComFB family protein [Vibrio maerlii]|uniref:late competence development ComFB family protein n=1 Tax=Vibrio maerlii TaxID=2231648 RepID=UPI000E3B97A6|nr:late competence development ComFB family protein [Vibrio maerlii]